MNQSCDKKMSEARRLGDKTKKPYFIVSGQFRDLASGYGACFASDRILVDGCKVGYMYRENPDFPEDGGWRFLSGDESGDYLNDQWNSGIYDVNTIANYDPDIVDFLDLPPGMSLIRDPQTGQFVTYDERNDSTAPFAATPIFEPSHKPRINILQEELDKLLEPLVKDTQILDPSSSRDAEKATVSSKFGGSPYAQVNDDWPQCPTCQNELVFIAQLKDEKTDNLFVFYYCIECFPWGLGDEEKGQWVVRRYKNSSMEKHKEIAPSKENEAAVIPCTVTTKMVKVIPDWEGLESYSMEASDLCCEMNDDSPYEAYDAAFLRNAYFNDYATILGGYPRWIQSEAINKCSECGAVLEFLAQIDSEDSAGLMWGDAGSVYLFQCRNHLDIFHLELQCY